MSETIGTRTFHLRTLPRSSDGLVAGISTVATVVNLAAIGVQTPSNSTQSQSAPGLQQTTLRMLAETADVGHIAGSQLADVTGAVTAILVTAGGSGYTSAPTVTIAASPFVGSFTMSAGGSGYTSPPLVTFSGSNGSGAEAVAVVTAGQVTGLVIAVMGAGYTSGAPTVAITGGGGSGAAATAVLATATATAVVSAGALASVNVTYQGAGYSGAPAITISGGGGSGGTASVTNFQNCAPALATTGTGAGSALSAPGICQRLVAGQYEDPIYVRPNYDRWLGVVGSTSGGTLRIFRRSE
jgi:hypothetical protein